MAETIDVEFKIKLDNDICKSSPWKTKEKFFKALVITHLDSDLGLIQRCQRDAAPQDKAGFKGLITTLKSIKKDINQSITYTTINTQDNIEEIQINFTYTHHENDFYNSKKFIQNYVFDQTIASSKSMIDITDFMKDINPKKKEKGIKIYKHLANMLKQAKKTVKFSNSNDVVISSSKNKMV